VTTSFISSSAAFCERPNAKTGRIAFFQLVSPLRMWCAGRTAVTCNGLYILLKSG
jgi:hypothetical protein